ncbi:MAG: rod shape-determining protein MreD [Cyanobacteriota bacterium]|nr:rod shape-determining protein MreD [Cyanobacteriota bacterium]
MFQHLPLPLRQPVSGLITALSGILATLAPWIRGPGLELAGLTPDWPLIWVVAWSVRRSVWEGAVAGLTLGFLQDALTSSRPTHALELAIVGILTARLQKQRYVQEDFISVALIVFGMVVIAETLMALQWTLFSAATLNTPTLSSLGSELGDAPRSLASIWLTHQKNTLISAILSSLWAPVLYLPLSACWDPQDAKKAK